MFIKAPCIVTDKNPKKTKINPKPTKKNLKYKTTTKKPQTQHLVFELEESHKSHVLHYPGPGRAWQMWQIFTFIVPEETSSAGNLFQGLTVLCPGKDFPSLNNLFFKDFHISYPRHHSTWIFPFLFAETYQIFKSHDQFANYQFWRL